MDGIKQYQISEPDLVELERLIPELSSGLAEYLTGRERTQLRRIKDILSNVRWGYGPIDCVERVDP